MMKLRVALNNMYLVIFCLLINSCSNSFDKQSNKPDATTQNEQKDLIQFSGKGSITDTLKYSFNTQVLDTSINNDICSTGKLGMGLWGIDLTISEGNKKCVQYFNLLNGKLDTVYSYSLASYSTVLGNKWAALSNVSFYNYNGTLYKVLTLESYYSTYTIYLNGTNAVAAYVFEAMRDYESVNPANLNIKLLKSKANLIAECDLYPMLLNH